MSRNLVSIFLSLTFLAFLAAPTVITLVDDSVDVSMYYAASEEEEKGCKKDKDIEKLFFETLKNEVDLIAAKREDISTYFFKKYPKLHLNLISPPPELNIL